MKILKIKIINQELFYLQQKPKKFYHEFKFKKNDFLLFGRESAGVPEEVHTSSYESLKVPLSKEARSLNVAMTVAVVASEALRQNNFFK